MRQMIRTLAVQPNAARDLGQFANVRETKDLIPVQKDKIREHLGKHLHELSTGDLNILYSMLVGLKPATDDKEAHQIHDAICDVVLQLLINGPSCNVPLEKLRAVEVPNPRMPRVLTWYTEAVPDAGFPREMVNKWYTMISDSKRSQWRHEAEVFDREA